MVKVRDIMSVDVVTVNGGATLRDAVELLAANHISGLPVMSGSEVVGVVSATDLLDFAAETPGAPRQREEPLEAGLWPEVEIWEDGEEPPAVYFADFWEDAGAGLADRFAETDSPEWDVLEDHRVGEIMTTTLCALSPEATVRDAARYMLRAGVHRILVLDAERLVGVISTTDVMKAVAEYGLAG